MVVCRTKGEVRALIDALGVSVDWYDLKIKQLSVDRNECGVNTVTRVISGEAEDVGEIIFGGEKDHLWIIHFTNAEKDGWGLYEESGSRTWTSI
jgi:hypothetical protein